jgi:hypothetical protein
MKREVTKMVGKKEELDNIVEAGDDLGEKIGRLKRKAGGILFFAAGIPESKTALRLLPKLARKNEEMVFIRVPVVEEECNGKLKVVAPEVRKSLKEDYFPQWSVFRDGIVSVPVVSRKDETGQLSDIRNLFSGFGIGIRIA